MGKSQNPCFKIIACGSDSKDTDDNLLPFESKQPSDKRRWSFRKKSARHQIPGNTEILEPQFVDLDKENSETIPSKIYSLKTSSTKEKTSPVEQSKLTAPFSLSVDNSENKSSIEQTNENTPLSTDIDNKESILIIEDNVHSEVPNVENTSDINTSTDDNLNEEDIIIIQAAARRFLAQREVNKVRKIVKLQAAVRAHLVRQQAIGTLRCVQAIVKMQALVRARQANQCQKKTNDKKDPDMKSNLTNSTIVKLLSNGFAHQLQESMPKTKPINISCDPLKNDYVWQWLERWMSVISSKVHQQQECNLKNSDQEKEENDSIFSLRNIKEILETDDFDHNESQMQPSDKKQCLCSPAEHHKEQSQENKFTERVKEYSKSVVEANSENLTNSTNLGTSDSVETEGKKLNLGTRKIRNPSFAAVQAKFEELSSVPKLSRSISISQETSIDSRSSHSQAASSVPAQKAFFSSGCSSIENPIIQSAVSECGTEISISSTLDSPDRSETDGGEIVFEIGASGEANHIVNSNSSSHAFELKKINADERMPSPYLNEADKEEKNGDHDITGNSDSVKVVIQQEIVKSEAYVLSPERTSKNDVPVLEIQGTPSSEISNLSKTSSTQTGSAHKLKSKPNLKNKSDENSNKRTFGVSVKLDSEPRRSTSNSSALPSYMQATKSARAKVQGSASLNSSPDVLEKDIHIKKRHSLPISEEKQGSSPRVQRSTSQTHQSLKNNNNNHSPHSSAATITIGSTPCSATHSERLLGKSPLLRRTPFCSWGGSILWDSDNWHLFRTVS